MTSISGEGAWGMAEEARLGPVARRLAASEGLVLVSDEPDTADFLRAYFRAGGYEFTHVDPSMTRTVLEVVQERRPRCILLDLDLHRVDGADLYRWLQMDSRSAGVPVILIGARADAHELVHGIRAIDAAMAKPYNVNDLADVVAGRIEATVRTAHEADAPCQAPVSIAM